MIPRLILQWPSIFRRMNCSQTQNRDERSGDLPRPGKAHLFSKPDNLTHKHFLKIRRLRTLLTRLMKRYAKLVLVLLAACMRTK